MRNREQASTRTVSIVFPTNRKDPIMRKVFKLDEIDCAVCAGKLEDAIKKLDGVQDAKINFLTQKLTLEAADEDFDAVLDAVVKLTAEVEPDCEILR
ncbi:heavy metal-associated domain protein [Collinsella intestinalis DSM 13280]|nr:heavy metal-associated domain protein [Collinsella intestinalis DSM 13280]